MSAEPESTQDESNRELKDSDSLETLIDQLPDEVKERPEILSALISVQTRREIRHSSAPIPDPETIKQYDAIIPNGAERIMVMAETQANHRRSLEASIVSEQIASNRRGQIFAAGLAVLLIIVGSVAFLTDHDAVSGTIFGVTVVGLVTVFVIGRKQEEKNSQSKPENAE